MMNARLFTASWCFYSLVVMFATLEMSHSMEDKMNVSKERDPMAPQQSENFWEIQNLELIFNPDSEIAGPVILIPHEMSSALTFSDENYLQVLGDYSEKIQSKDVESLLNHAFESCCQQFNVNDEGLKKILSNNINLQKLKARALLQKSTNDLKLCKSTIERYVQDLLNTFLVHSNYAIGQQSSDYSQLFQFKKHPIRISKAGTSLVESLDIYIPRRDKTGVYYDNYFFLGNKNAIKNMQHLVEIGEIKLSYNDTLCLKLVNVQKNSRLAAEFIFDKIK